MPSAEEVDKLIIDLDKVVKQLDNKGLGAIKRQGLEHDLLHIYGNFRDVLEDFLKSQNRDLLVEVFGGNCYAIARLATVLDSVEFTIPGTRNDQRTGMCRKMVLNVEGVLQDVGLAEKLKSAIQLEKHKQREEARASTAAKEEEEATKKAEQEEAEAAKKAEEEAEAAKKSQEREAAKKADEEAARKAEEEAAAAKEAEEEAAAAKAAEEEAAAAKAAEEEAAARKAAEEEAAAAKAAEEAAAAKAEEEAAAAKAEEAAAAKAEEEAATKAPEETGAEENEQNKEEAAEAARKAEGPEATNQQAGNIADRPEAVDMDSEIDLPGENAGPNPFDVVEHTGRVRQKNEACSIQVVSSSLEDELTKQIIGTKTVQELSLIKVPKRTKQPGPWMVYQVHRAHLNDPTLTSLDFTNMHMPTQKNEPNVAPKLMQSLEHNNHLEALILDNSNLQSVDARILNEVIGNNRTLSVLSLDNNSVSTQSLVDLAHALADGKSGVSILQVYNQLSESQGADLVEKAFLEMFEKNERIIRVFYEFGISLERKQKIDELCFTNYHRNPVCIQCAYKLPSPPPEEAQCMSCKKYVCSTIRECPQNGQLVTLKGTFDKVVPLELLGFPQHCWRNPVELQNLRSMLQRNGHSIYEAIDKTEYTKIHDDQLCKGCLAKISGDALYEYYMQTPPETIPPPAGGRNACWWGRNCRIQTHNMRHASRLNHICPQTNFELDRPRH